MSSVMVWTAPFSTVAFILAAMAVVAVIEVAIPLHARGQWNRRHLGPNLVLTLITFATNMIGNAPLVALLAWLEASGRGLLSLASLPALATAAIGITVLDLGTYLAHTTMHRVPLLWRFHSVHHSDPALDVTTTVRQHPGETLVRYVFLSVFAIGVGVSPATLAIYRAWSALNALFEHANIRLPDRLDRLLALVVVSPNMHKVHHSRSQLLTDTNFGNIFSIFDRLFVTFTPAERGRDIVYGLDGFDDEATQTTGGLLALPFRAPARRHTITVSRLQRTQPLG
jgi:sterol desaturase/sphingolipid hydroxylase (fatty acid hydroxylase superfamily)